VSRIVELTETGWDDDVLGSPTPVLVDVWAPWCIPCKRVTPIIEELAGELGDRLVVGRLNGDDAPRILGRYEVLSLPTLLLFAGGEEVGRVVGVPRADKLRSLIEPHLPGE
jgi:thioredoxin 1